LFEASAGVGGGKLIREIWQVVKLLILNVQVVQEILDKTGAVERDFIIYSLEEN
jgi:hypothetical protein